MTRTILLVDDDDKNIAELSKSLRDALKDEVEVVPWVPITETQSPEDHFQSLVTPNTSLVVTDIDLTGKGRTGLSGRILVRLCQSKSLPVVVFTRRLEDPTEAPDLFELRLAREIARHSDSAARAIASIFRGFGRILNFLDANAEKLSERPTLAGILAQVLAAPDEESEFALYAARIGTGTGALFDSMRQSAHGGKEPTKEERTTLIAYVLGHLLFNLILKYPGPLLSKRALCAYLAVGEASADDLAPLFETARYSGPFQDSDSFWWRRVVDDTLDSLDTASGLKIDADSPGGYRRKIVEWKLGKNLASHLCDRCKGDRGGFLCPFTGRTVCQLPECSEGSSSWLPQGARVCRIEKDFFDEWEPLLAI